MALDAKYGSDKALWDVLAHFHGYVTNLSDKYRNMLRSQQDYEEDCFKRIEEAVKTYDPKRGNFEAHALAKIRERTRRWQKRNIARTRGAVVISINREIDDNEYDIVDELALVDDNVLLNERITGLASGDPRKLAILKSWTEPYFNDSTTASLLAQRLGGKEETHRKAIGRFRTECQKALAYAI
ncbi:hypothetical protein G5B47_02360 [Paenibacillus sp. 7124]|uniref:Uncharacterized protein n=1 Tax=Paenibacillus apii TaxID=1850370 RepID=A0A6M1PLN5_9BACL|nr:hypothetical protein [Paenibacillus apii]NGM81251.1 hypothetical protein [Paenibacillus apii]